MSFHGLVGESWTSIAQHGSKKQSTLLGERSHGGGLCSRLLSNLVLFVSVPSHGERCCIDVLRWATGGRVVRFSPLLSRWKRGCICTRGARSAVNPWFQCPSRWGRFCITRPQDFVVSRFLRTPHVR